MCYFCFLTQPIKNSILAFSSISRVVVRDLVNDLLAYNIIQESEFAIRNHRILVKKKDGSYIMCVSFRELNQQIDTYYH